MHRTLLLLTIVFVFQPNITLHAQTDSTANDAESTITVGAGYSTNTNAFGNVNTFVSQPSFSGNFNYNGKKGFNLLFSPSFIGNSDSTNSKFTSEYDFGIGYSKTLMKVLSLSTSYTHYLYSSNSTSLKSGFNDYAQLGAGLSVKWWGLNVAGGYGWGQTTDFSFNAGTKVSIKLKNAFGEDNDLVFKPTIGITMSKNELSNLNSQKKLKGLDVFVKSHPNLTANDFLTSTDPAIVAWRNEHPAVVSSISKKLDKMKSKGNGKKQKSDILLADILTSSKTSFGLTSINISIPITFDIGDFSFDISPTYTKPNNSTDPAEFYVSFGVSYSFGL